MSKALADFYDLMMPELPGCTTAMVDLQLVQMARTFCEQTSAWREAFDPLDTVAGQADYYLQPSEAQAEVVRIVDLHVNSCWLWSNTPRDHESRFAKSPKYDRDCPPFNLSGDLEVLTLVGKEVPSASVVGGLQVIGAMKPKANATRLPDMLLSQYSDVIRFGTLARLMVMAKKPWTDRALASAYMSEWNRGLNYAAVQAQTGNSRPLLRVHSY